MSGDESALHTRPSLLVRIRDGADAEAWRKFMTIYVPIVYRFACRHGLQDADAADLSQEVMGKVARAIRTFEYHPERGRFRDWLFTIVRQCLTLHFQGLSRRPERLLSPAELEYRARARKSLTPTGPMNSMLKSWRWHSIELGRTLNRSPGRRSSVSGWRTVPLRKPPMNCASRSISFITPSRES